MTPAETTMEGWARIPALQAAPDLFGSDGQRRAAETMRRRGLGRILWIPEPETALWVDTLRRESGAALCPVVPNMAAYARDTRDRGLVGAALDRMRPLPPASVARICLGAIPRALDVLRRDFATGVCLLAEMELARYAHLRPPCVFLNSQLVDLAMAFGNRRLFERFGRLARRYRAEFGLMTSNFGLLAPRLAEWKIAPDRLVAPFNPLGHLMYPDPAECERRLPALRGALVADCSPTRRALPLDAQLDWLRGAGVARFAMIPDEPGPGGATP